MVFVILVSSLLLLRKRKILQITLAKCLREGGVVDVGKTWRELVQSLYSPFFPPHIGAEPGRAKEESRITCMRRQYEKIVWEKSNDAYSLSIRIQTTINHISIFTFLCFL